MKDFLKWLDSVCLESTRLSCVGSIEYRFLEKPLSKEYSIFNKKMGVGDILIFAHHASKNKNIFGGLYSELEYLNKVKVVPSKKYDSVPELKTCDSSVLLEKGVSLLSIFYAATEMLCEDKIEITSVPDSFFIDYPMY